MNSVQSLFINKKYFLKKLLIFSLVTSFLLNTSSLFALAAEKKFSDPTPVKSSSISQTTFSSTDFSSQNQSPTEILSPVSKDYKTNLSPNDPSKSYVTQEAVDTRVFLGPIAAPWMIADEFKKFEKAVEDSKQSLLKFIPDIITTIVKTVDESMMPSNIATCLWGELEKKTGANPTACAPQATNEQTNLGGKSKATYNPPSGLIALTATTIDQIHQSGPQMINTQDYLAYINPFQPKDAYAQGIGRDRLNVAALEIWGVLRNVSYAFLVLVLVVVGFMVMFRAKMDPRTTVSLINSLPRVVLVLILITFSFPIGALAIDLIGLLLNLVGCGVNLYCSYGSYNQNVFLFMTGGVILTSVLAAFQIPTIPGIGFLAVIILLFILLLVTFVIIARIGIAFITEWISLFFTIVAAPLYLLGGSLPGSSSIKGWFKRLLAPVLCIVSMYTMVAIAGKFSSTAIDSSFSSMRFIATGTSGIGFNIPQFIPSPNLTGSSIPLTPPLFNDLVSLGILLFTPAICTNIKKALDVVMSDQGSINPMEMSRDATRARSTAISELGTRIKRTEYNNLWGDQTGRPGWQVAKFIGQLLGGHGP
ncbi:MAG: hypothetical protein M1150_03815 [Patescibacteria group bacterium]|nr:hypothetical protein [Patescibacteria group bacterium]